MGLALNKGARLLWLAVALVVSACSTVPDAADSGQPVMREVYEQNAGGGLSATRRTGGVQSRPPADPDPHYHSYTRSVETQAHNLFPRLDNPTLFMYVRPRAVGESGLPVPGYTVPIKMWRSDHYALPGETPRNDPSVEVRDE